MSNLIDLYYVHHLEIFTFNLAQVEQPESYFLVLITFSLLDN